MSLRPSFLRPLLPLTLVVACSNSVETADGSGGSGSGSSGDVTVGTTASTTSSTSSTTSSTTASTTTGGGTECEMACQHLQDCTGFDVCSQFNQLDCSNPQSDCPSACINDASCAEILALAQNQPSPTLQACIGACQGGGTGGGMQGSCSDCAQNSCTAQIGACFQDNACQAWLNCAGMCSDAACYATCDTNNPNAGAARQAVVDCACTDCNAACAAQIGTCGGVGAGGGMMGTGGAGGN